MHTLLISKLNNVLLIKQLITTNLISDFIRAFSFVCGFSM